MAHSERRTVDASSIVEMDIVDDDASDYDMELSTSPKRDDDASRKRAGATRSDESDEATGNLSKQVGAGVASYVWEEGRQRARKAFSIYGNIDILRPYFDVDPHTVRNRLIHSLIPKRPKSGNQQEKVPRELYGPTMVVFTLIAILLFQMKTSGHTVQEGTLMGSAFGVCFGYWLGISSLVWVMAYVCNTFISMLQILSLLGYALFGQCVVLFITTVGHNHFMFYLLWIFVGGLSTLRMISILMSRTSGRTQRLIMCGVVASLHLLFLIYLHFAYHQTVEEISAVLQGGVVPKMAAQPNIAGAQNVQGVLPREAVVLEQDPEAPHVLLDAVTRAVKRAVRDAAGPTPAAALAGGQHLPAEGNVNLDMEKESKLLKALVPERLASDMGGKVVEAFNATVKGMHKAINATKLS